MKNTAEMTLGSLFDGIAGFPLAARRQGIKTVWVSEIEPDCIDIAKRHFPEALQLGDITQIDGAKIPVVDIISFGSPKGTPYFLWRPGRGYDSCLCVCFHLFSQVRVAVMKLREFLTVFEQSDRLRIVKNEKDVYTGFLALMAHAGNMETLMDAEVKRFRPTPEIRHKEWQKRGLMAPLQPQETPEYSFSDLQMNLYNTIYL